MAHPIRLSTRDALLEAARELWTEQPRASLGAVAERAGVGRATLHRHFEGRADLARELALQSIREIDEACAELGSGRLGPTEALQRMIEIVVPIGDRYHFLMQMSELLDDPVVTQETERQNAWLVEMVRTAQAEGGLRKDTPLAWIVRSCDALIYAAWQSIGAGEMLARDASTHVVQTLLCGVGASTKEQGGTSR